MLGVAEHPGRDLNTSIWADEPIHPKHDISPDVVHLAAKLRSLNDADRRLDCEVARFVLAPEGARLQPEAGLDGWDILETDGQVWLEAADIPYATGYVDAAQQLCRQAAGDFSEAIVIKALRRVMKTPHRFDQGDVAGLIARHILAALVEWTPPLPAR
jgi:hypothetical protein